jgi:putative transposase
LLARRPVTYYILFLINLHTRRVHIAGMTPYPDGLRTAQIARNMSMFLGDQPAELQPTHIIRDRDRKFTEEFCSILESDGIESHPLHPAVQT